MAGHRVQAPRARASLAIVPVDDPQTARALDQVGAAVQRLEAARSRDTVTTDLVVGLNRVRHGLGRAALGYTLVATAADATFAHAIDLTNPRPDLEVWVRVVGIGQLGARLEVW